MDVMKLNIINFWEELIMISRNVTILNKTGIHARPASLFISTASKYKSNITIEKAGKKGNAKSMINILGMCLTAGTEISIYICFFYNCYFI